MYVNVNVYWVALRKARVQQGFNTHLPERKSVWLDNNSEYLMCSRPRKAASQLTVMLYLDLKRNEGQKVQKMSTAHSSREKQEING